MSVVQEEGFVCPVPKNIDTWSRDYVPLSFNFKPIDYNNSRRLPPGNKNSLTGFVLIFFVLRVPSYLAFSKVTVC